jgi:hypothetical protein
VLPIGLAKALRPPEANWGAYEVPLCAIGWPRRARPANRGGGLPAHAAPGGLAVPVSAGLPVGTPAGKPSTPSPRGRMAIAYFPFPSRSATSI